MATLQPLNDGEILQISGATPPHVSACAPDHERSTLTEKLKRDFSTIFSAADEIMKRILSNKKSTDADDMTSLLQGVCDMFDAAMEPNASEATKIRKLKSLSLLEPPCVVISETGRHLLVSQRHPTSVRESYPLMSCKIRVSHSF
ncbi:unnamed protein product [Dibothriocephalus latus]|uniref:Uncharacterized protein n=1 Tax=Dibothriocephalus latus TaxID=60516 RepID=A0A3P7QFJ3_DIBLA|nr:unnamed protein product [Dibothriocephalus latus]